MEGLYNGKASAPIVAFGILNPKKKYNNDEDEFLFKFEIPDGLSLLGFHSFDAYVPGVKELINGDKEHGIMSTQEKLDKGKIAVASLGEYKRAKKENDADGASVALKTFEEHAKYLGYGYLNKPSDVIPNIPLTFYAFHTMVTFGTWFIVLFMVILYLTMTNELKEKKWFLKLALWSLPLGTMAQESGWIVAEAGRQPWAIQDMLPVGMATSQISSSSVMITFWLFAVLFTALLIAEVKIMTKQIKIGPEEA